MFSTGIALLLPLATVVLIPFARRHANVREGVSLFAALVVFGAAASLLPAVMAGERPHIELIEFLPGAGITFTVEPLGLAFALISSLLWFVTVVYSIGYMRAHNERNQTRFYSFFALAIAITVAAAFAGNLLTLYLLYEALTLATYPLVTHGGEDRDRAGGRRYLLILFGTSLTFMLLAMAWTYSIAGTLEFTDGGIFLVDGQLPDGLGGGLLALLYALFLFGTGKAALVPFHRWLPAAMVAPTPVSALLHAVAVFKLGVIKVLKIT
ncbi:MAG: monovalent cation/H+ antiporter subunit D family protein, partial [Proteobacteria bacterium]|nr:monovalent cation/H+ antiporter subunit D family protein [Pseudomonadota bacterium]